MIYRGTLEQSQLIDDVCDFCNEQIGTITNDMGDTITKYIPYWVTEYGCVCSECRQTLHSDNTEGKQQ